MPVVTFFLALLPLLVVLYLMLGRKWGGAPAGTLGWLTAVLISLAFFGANGTLLAVASGRALLLALYVLYIIWMALLNYHVINEAGAIRVIGQELPKVASDRAAQVLLLAWIFGAFLQGAAGFGVPAAVVAPLLVGLGFAPTVAVAAALMGHAWAITFGSLGSSFVALEAASGMDPAVLAGPAAVYLGICCFLCGVIVLWASDRWEGLRRRGLLLIGLSLVMGVTQWGIAAAGFYNLAAFGASIAGLIVILLLLQGKQLLQRSRAKAEALDLSQLGVAFIPYAFLTLSILVGQLLLADALDLVVLNYSFPEVSTSSGWSTAAGEGRSISLFGHPGALLIYASLLAFGWYKWRGTLSPEHPYSGRVILSKVVKGSRKSTISIITLVGMAATMQHAGMTQVLAEGLSNTGTLFPFLSPFIGALGAFMTGSNTNSNVVFTDLQRQTALALSLSPALILAAQTAGGALGSVFAPAKVVVGCSTVEGAEDNTVLQLALLYGLSVVVIIGLLTWLLV